MRFLTSFIACSLALFLCAGCGSLVFQSQCTTFPGPDRGGSQIALLAANCLVSSVDGATNSPDGRVYWDQLNLRLLPGQHTLGVDLLHPGHDGSLGGSGDQFVYAGSVIERFSIEVHLEAGKRYLIRFSAEKPGEIGIGTRLASSLFHEPIKAKWIVYIVDQNDFKARRLGTVKEVQ
jgi:hypothetical protein